MNLLTPQLYSPGEEDRVNQLEALVKENEEKHNQLERELQKKDKNVTDLKRQLRKTEKSFVEELKKRDQQVLALKMDLDSKSSTIAYLTTEMHKFKLTHLSTTKQTKDMTDRLQSPTMTDRNEKLESHRIVSAKDIRSRPVTSKGTKRRPDAEVFLAQAVQQDTEAESVAVKPIPPVLPPIVGGDELNKKVFSRRQQLIRRRLDLKSQPEYSKLAVDKIASTANTWVHEPKTTTE